LTISALSIGAAAAGFDAATFAGHSLRAGFLTSAARGGADEQRMMEQSGHRSIEVARRYIRRGKIWDEHPAYRVGL
jgi:integrase